jgi:hypothetical protein
VVFDFDSANMQALNAANPSYVAAFDPQYRVLYTFAAQADSTGANQQVLGSTPLRTPQDQ